jgi:hypothetical protein
LEGNPLTYRSALGSWHHQSSVRSKPRRCLSPEADHDGLTYFPADLSPFVSHKLVSSGDPAVTRDGLTQQLFSYLTFTDRLEHEIVNRTARRLAEPWPSLSLPDAMKIDARKIYCDEAYHSLFSADLMYQIQTATGFEYDAGSGHPALVSFAATVESFPLEERPWVELFFVVVSETLISGSLLRIPESETVIPVVRDLVADHAADEVRHHAFFTQVCRLAWPQMPRNLQARVGCALPGFIRNFLSPDYPSIQAFLERRFSQRQAETILRESYPEAELLKNARNASRATIRAFAGAGAFDIPEVADQFHKEGFSMPAKAHGATL